jgi:exosortase B
MTVPSAAQLSPRGTVPNWIPISAGLLCLYVPTYFDLYETFWRTRDGAYAPVILAFVAWLSWRNRKALLEISSPPLWMSGTACISLGLASYVIGRSQSFYNLEVVSQLPLLLGIVLLVLGRAGLRSLWFPILLLAFVVPIPGSLLDSVLLQLKELVSLVVDNALHLAGFPIARNGVVLMIGPYSLLIADACAGLNSIIALSGIGLIYVYLSHHSSRWLSAILLLSAVPIAVLANIIRVMTLVLVTYYMGNDAGMAFHDNAGYAEIIVAFGCFFMLDGALMAVHRRLHHSTTSAS